MCCFSEEVTEWTERILSGIYCVVDGAFRLAWDTIEEVDFQMQNTWKYNKTACTIYEDKKEIIMLLILLSKRVEINTFRSDNLNN